MERDARETWRRRLERCRRSGLTTEEFARREGVSARTLTWWRWRLARDGEQRSAARKARRRKKGAVGFVEIVGATAMSTASSDAFELESGRYRVRVPARFEAEALERLLRVLEGR